MKPRVLITVPDLNLAGGVAIMFRALQNHFSPAVDYFTMGRRSSENSAYLKIKRIIRDYRNYHSILINGNYDVVQINPSLKKGALIRDALFIVFAKRNRKKVVVFFHGWDWALAHRLSNGFLNSIFKRIYFSADGIVVLASEFAKKIKDMGYKGTINIGNVAIEDSIAQWTNTPIERWENPDEFFNILFLTRIEKYKGIYEAIEAFKILKGKYNQVNLIIAGGGSELNNVRQYVKKNNIGDVEFTGYVDGKNKHEVFKKADCYLFPSYSEGMPISLIEAFAYGLPAITRFIGGLRDFFENKKMGYITKSKDPTVFAELMEKLITDETMRKQIGKYNKEYARKYFSASIVAHRLEQILTDTASGLAGSRELWWNI